MSSCACKESPMTPPIEVSRRSLGSLCRRISALVALVIALITLGSPPPAAEAHAFLASSNPATGAILAVAPERVTLRFTEPLERSYSEASLFDRTGAPVEGATFGPGADEFSMDVVVPAGVANGTYSVLWRTLSTADGHTAEGFVTFTVGSQSDVAPLTLPARAAESSVPSWLPPLARWISLLGLAGCVAIWPLWLFVLRPAISPAWQAGPALARRMKRFAAASVGVAFGGSVLALLVQAASTAGDDGLIENLGPTLLDTRYG